MNAKLITALAAVLITRPIAAWPQDQAPKTEETPPSLQPPLAVTLTGNPTPARFDVGALGPVYLTSVLSGLAQWQTNPVPADRMWQFDADNLQLFLNKPDGPLQFFIQAGYYSLPAIGVPYMRAVDATQEFFTPFPQAYLKFAPTESFSVLLGKLPTLIGAESTFSFQNMNVQRGLLWNQENAVNRGLQVNYLAGPLTLAASLNDGFYSNRYSWVSLSASYAIDKANTLAVILAGNTKHTDVSTTRTPLAQNNQRILNLIYTRTDGPWTIQPYLQYTHVPEIASLGIFDSASTYGAALLMSYDFGSDAAPASIRTPGFKLPVRLEYIGSSGIAGQGAPNLLYGQGSGAWSLTVTPTYQHKNFFVRAEISYVGTKKITPGFAFGTDGNKGTQVRALFELGVLL